MAEIKLDDKVEVEITLPSGENVWVPADVKAVQPVGVDGEVVYTVHVENESSARRRVSSDRVRAVKAKKAAKVEVKAEDDAPVAPEAPVFTETEVKE